jgi:RsiW-degrading membrane proteinase PrsW (M82 family)
MRNTTGKATPFPNFAALFMMVAMVGFTLNDTITGLLPQPMNMAQVMLVRGAFASLCHAVSGAAHLSGLVRCCSHW